MVMDGGFGTTSNADLLFGVLDRDDPNVGVGVGGKGRTLGLITLLSDPLRSKGSPFGS